jgi:hypothetical protein
MDTVSNLSAIHDGAAGPAITAAGSSPGASDGPVSIDSTVKRRRSYRITAIVGTVAHVDVGSH